MDTDWIFDGIVDSEEKEYRLLSYFQKINQRIDEMKVYPSFTEISLHLGNIQSLINQNKTLYSERELSSFDDELLISDLKLKDIPVLDKDEYIEYQKILKYSLPKFEYYFGLAKSIWVIVYDSIKINVKRNKKNLNSKKGFFYFNNKDILYIWEYNIRKVRNSDNLTKTNIKLIHQESISNLTIQEIISNFLLFKNNKSPIFEVKCSDIFPLEETLIPIFKRKIMSYITQSIKIENNKSKKMITHGD